ncbi:MAG: hypothetical protein NE330_22075 [Lentisphaeraceae bacterium]|nr:hypothetical protein [Lentisphaeraceae bacterium]
MSLLDPGFIPKDQGVAFISWYCVDGRELHMPLHLRQLNRIKLMTT